MATCFDRWEKDPFFPAAEEVQESADRYRFFPPQIRVLIIEGVFAYLLFCVLFSCPGWNQFIEDGFTSKESHQSLKMEPLRSPASSIGSFRQSSALRNGR